MSITSVSLGFDETFDSTLNVKQRTKTLEVSGQITYIVVTNSFSTTEIEVKSATGIPTEGDSYGDYVVKGKTASRLSEGALVWRVTVKYGTTGLPEATTAVGSGSSAETLPSKWNLECSVDSVTEKQPVYKDMYGNGIKNSAGDAFDPPLEQD